jgi:hypothetical protein
VVLPFCLAFFSSFSSFLPPLHHCHPLHHHCPCGDDGDDDGGGDGDSGNDGNVRWMKFVVDLVVVITKCSRQ